MHEEVTATGTVISDKGWQVIKPGTVVTDAVVNAGVGGGSDVGNGDTGQSIRGDAVCITIDKNGRQIVRAEGTANTAMVYTGGDQTVHGHALGIMLNRGYQHVHNGGTVSDAVANSGGWQIIKNGDVAGDITVNRKGRLQVDVGSTAMNVILKQGGALVTSTAAIVTGVNRLGALSIVRGKADNVVLENGGRPGVLTGHTATNTHVDGGGTLGVRNSSTAATASIGNGGVLLADSGATVSGTRSDGKAFNTEGGQADALMLEKGSPFTLDASDTTTDTTVNGGLFTARGNALADTITLNSGVVLTLSGETVNNDTLTIRRGDTFLRGDSLAGSGSVRKPGSGALTVSNTTPTQKAVNLNEGALTLNDGTVTTNVIARRGAALKLTGSTVLNGAIDPTNVILASGVTWNIPDSATVQPVIDNLDHTGQIHFTSTCTGKFAPAILKVKNLSGQNGTINLRVRPDTAQNNADKLVIDGGRTAGKTILNLVNASSSASRLVTSGKGIQVVEAINDTTTEEGAFTQGSRLQADAFNYSLDRDSDESWYLYSKNAYRAEIPLYAFILTQAMDYDRTVAGSCSHQIGVNGENSSARLSVQGGHLGHDSNGGIARGTTLKSSDSYGLVRLKGGLMRTEVADMSMAAGVYGVAGHSSVNIKNDDGSRAGTVRDDAGSLGGCLSLVHMSPGLWADIVVQGIRHSVKASSENSNFHVRGWG